MTNEQNNQRTWFWQRRWDRSLAVSCFLPGRITGRDEESLGNHGNLDRFGVECQLLHLFHALVCPAWSMWSIIIFPSFASVAQTLATLCLFCMCFFIYFYPNTSFFPDAGCTHRGSGKVSEKFQEVVKKTQTRMNDELPPVILQSFKYHDKVDLSGSNPLVMTNIAIENSHS